MPKHCYYNLYIWLKQVSFCQTETTSHLIKFMFPVFINSSSYDNFNSYLYQIRHGCCCGQCVFIFFFNLDKSYYWLNNSLSIHENSAIQNIALLFSNLSLVIITYNYPTVIFILNLDLLVSYDIIDLASLEFWQSTSKSTATKQIAWP